MTSRAKECAIAIIDRIWMDADNKGHEVGGLPQEHADEWASWIERALLDTIEEAAKVAEPCHPRWGSLIAAEIRKMKEK